MLGVLAGLALLSLATPSRRSRGLGDDLPTLPALPSGEPLPPPPRSAEAYLVRPADYVHPSKRAEAVARGVREGSTWAVVPATGWAGARPFPTAKAARTVLTAAGFRGPYGRGQFSKWVKG